MIEGQKDFGIKNGFRFSGKIQLSRSFLEKYLFQACLFGIVLLSFLMNFHTLSDTDIFWQLKSGEIIFKSYRVPDRDIFSFTMIGDEWINSQWLFQLFIYIIYHFSGYFGIIFFGAVITAITWFIIIVPGFRSERYLLIVIFLIICLLTAVMRFKLRPEILTFLYISLEIFLIERLLKGKRYAIFLLGFLLLIWVNSEGLWPIYFVILLSFLIEEFFFIPEFGIQKYLRRTISGARNDSGGWLWVCFFGFIPLALLNPYGHRGFIFPWRLFREISFPGSFIGKAILEFQSPFSHQFPLIDKVPYIMLLGFSLLMIIFLLLTRRIYPAGFLLFVIFLYLSFIAVRNVALFAVLNANLFIRIIAGLDTIDILSLRRVKERSGWLRLAGEMVILIFMIYLMVDVISGHFYIRNRTYSKFGIGVLETEYPVRAGNFLKSFFKESGNKRELRIFSDLGSAGYLIWLGYPEWKVYIDPRLELYGEEMLGRYSLAVKFWRYFEIEDARYSFDVVLLSSFLMRKDIILNLYKSEDWILIYFDGLDVIFFKRSGENSELLERYQIDFERGYFSPVPEGLRGVWLLRERLYRGYLVLILGYPELAVKELVEGHKIDPDEPNLNYYLGLAYNQLNKPEEAKIYLERLARLYPDSARALIPLARTYVMLGDMEEAIRIYKDILRREPDELNACIDLAMVYEKMGSGLSEGQWRMCRGIYERFPYAHQDLDEELLKELRRH